MQSLVPISERMYPYVIKNIEADADFQDPYNLLDVFDKSKKYAHNFTVLTKEGAGLNNYGAERSVSERLFQVRVHEPVSVACSYGEVGLVELVNLHLDDQVIVHPGDEVAMLCVWNLEAADNIKLLFVDSEGDHENRTDDDFTEVTLSDAINASIIEADKPENAGKVFEKHMLVFENNRIDYDWDRMKGTQKIFVDFLRMPENGYDYPIDENTVFHDFVCIYGRYLTRV